MTKEMKISVKGFYFICLLMSSLGYGFGAFVNYLEKTQYQETPIEVTYIHLNKDKIKDRLISSQAGLYQMQFGYKKSKTDEIEYLTTEQIIRRARQHYDKEKLKLEEEKSDLIKELEKRYF